ncbi:MAG: transglycosylase SLT domain-containing protein [bacterium]
MNNISFLKDKKIPLYVTVGIIIAFFVLNSSFIPFIDEISPFTSESRRLYILAIEHQKNNEYKEAIIDYVKIPSVYRAHDAVLFQMAKCAAAIGEEKTTIESLKKLVSRHHSSPLAPIGLYNLGQAYVRTSQPDEAEYAFKETIADYPDSNYAKGSLYYMGALNFKKDANAAIKYWMEYLAKSPDGRFSQEILNKLATYKDKFNSNQKFTYGKSLFLNNRYNEALEVLKQTPAAESWYSIAEASHEMGKDSSALFFLKEGLVKYANSQDDDNIEKAMELYTKLSPASDLEDWSFLGLNAAKKRDYALYEKASYVSKENAIEIYKQIAGNYTKGKYASEALWNVFWDKFKKSQYQEAIALGEQHNMIYQNTAASPEIMFWTAKAYERTRQPRKAKRYYEKLIGLYPDSYYAFRAKGRIEYIETGNDPGWNMNISEIADKSPAENDYPYSLDMLKKQFGSTVAELVLAGDTDTLELITDDKFIQSWIKEKRGMKSKSIVIARDEMNDIMPKPSVDDVRWKMIYPLRFLNIINKYAQYNNIDPLIALSLTREESYFNPLAVSYSNARGLMQILPGTANDVARWNNLSPVSAFELFDPETNIKIGTSYIKYTKSELWYNNMFAVAAYNCGPAAIKRWASKKTIQDYDEFVEDIPYAQTRTYVKKVFRTYWNYKRLYNL